MCRDDNKDTRRTSYLHTGLENSLQPFFAAIAHYALPPFWKSYSYHKNNNSTRKIFTEKSNQKKNDSR